MMFTPLIEAVDEDLGRPQSDDYKGTPEQRMVCS
jgi:hypothetical protein